MSLQIVMMHVQLPSDDDDDDDVEMGVTGQSPIAPPTITDADKVDFLQRLAAASDVINKNASGAADGVEQCRGAVHWLSGEGFREAAESEDVSAIGKICELLELAIGRSGEAKASKRIGTAEVAWANLCAAPTFVHVVMGLCDPYNVSFLPSLAPSPSSSPSPPPSLSPGSPSPGAQRPRPVSGSKGRAALQFASLVHASVGLPGVVRRIKTAGHMMVLRDLYVNLLALLTAQSVVHLRVRVVSWFERFLVSIVDGASTLADDAIALFLDADTVQNMRKSRTLAVLRLVIDADTNVCRRGCRDRRDSRAVSDRTGRSSVAASAPNGSGSRVVEFKDAVDDCAVGGRAVCGSGDGGGEHDSGEDWAPDVILDWDAHVLCMLARVIGRIMALPMDRSSRVVMALHGALEEVGIEDACEQWLSDHLMTDDGGYETDANIGILIDGPDVVVGGNRYSFYPDQMQCAATRSAAQHIHILLNFARSST